MLNIIKSAISELLYYCTDCDKPEYIPDPDATKPDDWDDDTDGEWEPLVVCNPDYNVDPQFLLIISMPFKALSH